MKTEYVGIYRLNKTLKAPLDFAFAWCTDFRADDPKMIGSKTRRNVIERTKKRVIWRVKYKDGRKDVEGIRAVWLMPPDAWHLDTCGDGREVGDYKMVPVGKSSTRLEMVFEETYDEKDKVPSKTEWLRDAKKHWDAYAKFLEQDYKKFKKAHGEG